MNSTKRLAATVAGAVAIATLVGTSAFAEARHHDGTDHGRSQQSDHHDSNRGSHDRSNNNNHQSQTNNQTFEHRDNRGSAPAQTYRGSASQSWERRDTHNFDQSNTRFDRRTTQPDTFRNNRSWDNNRGFDNNRGNNRSFDNNRSNDRWQSSRGHRPDFDDRGRHSDFVRGRINRFVHERGGYRIWIDGGRFPVWIPEARIGLFPRLRVGLSLNFGGYYDPLGYLEAYDYYDAGAYGYGSYDIGATSSGVLRGVIETVDYRRGTLVLRDEASGNFVTTLIRDRRLEDLRPGDYAEISGDWTRNGVFEGLRLEDTNGGRY